MPDGPRTATDDPEEASRADASPRPETALWDALVDAGPEGVPVAELETASGMGRSWIYYRLHEHAKADRAIQVRRGHWRAVRPPQGPGR